MIISDKRQLSLKPKLSVIIPVYNTAKFVHRTLSSFDKSGSPDIEIIIVNDGSLDNSVDVVNAWLETYEGNALFISQENQGLSQARNAALEYARGDYISFCDSDDWINQNTLTDCIDFAYEEQLDIVLYRSYVYDNQSKSAYPFYDAHVWDNILGGERSVTGNIHSYPQLLLLEPNTNNRLIKKSFFDKYVSIFPVGIHFEDVLPHVVSLVNADKVGLLDSVGYFYRVNREGKITEQKSEKRFDIIKTADELMHKEALKSLNDYQYYCVISLLLKMIFWCGRNTMLSDRRRFFSAATALFSRANAEPRQHLKRALNFTLRNREFVLMVAFYNGAVDFLTEYSMDKKTSSTKIKLLRSLVSTDPQVNKLILKKSSRFIKNKTFRKIAG